MLWALSAVEFASMALKFGDPRPHPRTSGTGWGWGHTHSIFLGQVGDKGGLKFQGIFEEFSEEIWGISIINQGNFKGNLTIPEEKSFKLNFLRSKSPRADRKGGNLGYQSDFAYLTKIRFKLIL